jgi:hypothetical protein
MSYFYSRRLCKITEKNNYAKNLINLKNSQQSISQKIYEVGEDMNRKFFYISLMFFIILTTTNLMAAKYKVLSCNPSELDQGEQNITLNLTTNLPMPQNSNNEYLYSEIQFSNPGIHVKDVKFLNALVINCVIDTDKYVDISKPVDINIVSYDEKGDEAIFEGKKMLTLKRKPYVEKIVVHTIDGKIKQGDGVNITLKGYNFQTGALRVLLMMSGLPPVETECNNSRQVRFSLTAEQTKILQKGEYGIYIYNKDGSGCQAIEKVVVG